MAAKDAFLSIKNIAHAEQLATPRIPPQLMRIVPEKAAEFESIRDVAMLFFANEIAPILATLRQLNDWLGEEVIRFKEFVLSRNGWTYNNFLVKQTNLMLKFSFLNFFIKFVWRILFIN